MIADLSMDTFVTVIGRKGGWLHVQTTTAEGKEVEGYVSQELVAFNRYDFESGPTSGDVLRLDQTVSIKGPPADQPNYADRAIREITSPFRGRDFILIPRTDATGQNGISIPKGDFHTDNDPLSSFHGALLRVYRSREVAEAVVADLDKLTPNVLHYAYYMKDGIIFPTILSDTTLPNLTSNIRQKREQNLRYNKAAADLAEDLLWWYVGARLPIRVKGTPGAAPAAGAGALESLSPLQRTITSEAQAILRSKELSTLRAAHQAGKSAEVVIGGRKILYEASMPSGQGYRAMTLLEENGFALGRDAFTSEAELTKTLLHELHRLATTASKVEGLSQPLAAQETASAQSFSDDLYALGVKIGLW